MEILNSIAAFIQKLFQWWFLVMPWEQAIQVRRGNIVKLREAGIYFRIPFIDNIYVQTTRMRMIDTPMQTVSTLDGHTLTIKATIGYTICDIEKLYNSLYHPEMTLCSMAMGCVGEYIRDKKVEEVSPALIERHTNDTLTQTKFGLRDVQLKITTFAVVKTFRLIQDGSGLYEQLSMVPVK